MATHTRKQSQAWLFGWLSVGGADSGHDEPDTSPRALWRTLRGDAVTLAALAAFGLIVVLDLLALAVSDLGFLADAADLGRLAVAVLVLKAGLARVVHREERRFWNELALAFGFWFLSLAVLTFAPAGRGVDLASAILYAASFLALVVAVERPIKGRRGRDAADDGVTLTWSGGTVFVLGILFYFVLAPLAFDLPTTDMDLMNYFMYLVIDFYVLGKLIYFGRITESLRWRMLYSLITLMMAAVFLSDLLDSLVAAGALSAPWPVVAGLSWNLPFLFLLSAARLRHHPFPTEESYFDSVDLEDPLPRPRERLVGYALFFPLMHFVFHFAGLLDEASQPVREGFVLIWLTFFGALAMVQQRVVETKTRALWRERRASDEALHQSDKTLRLAEKRRNAESALRKSEEKFNKASRSIPDAMLISTLAEGRLIEVNESFERQFGYSRQEALGKTGIELKLWVEPEDRAMMTRLVRQRGRVSNLEFELTKKTGEKRLTLLSGEIIDLDGERCLLMVLRDITEKRELEEKLRRARRLESIGTLTSAIASDLKGVLVPIRNTIRELRKAPFEQKYEPFLADLEKQARRGMEMVRQILTFSGRDELASAPSSSPKEAPGDLPVGDGECVLVLGDDVSIRDLLRETLEACGYLVYSAEIGSEAVELYARRRNEIDVVLIDGKKTAPSCEVTMRKLLALDPGVAVIAVNGSTAEETAASENVRIHLEKPYTAEKLLTSLKRVLETAPPTF